jgi:hypothetical protein
MILGVWFLPKHLEEIKTEHAKYDYAHYDVPKGIRNHCYRHKSKIKGQIPEPNGYNRTPFRGGSIQGLLIYV